MGIFSRIALIIRSTINALISRAEDPEKVLDTIICDLTENMGNVKVQVASAMSDQKTLERKVEENLQSASDYENRAMAALSQNDEPLAVEALKRKQTCIALAASFSKELEAQKKVVEKLKDGTRNLEYRIEEAKTRRTTLLAQQKRAEARTQLTSNVGTLSKQSELLETFERMADKIAQFEDMSEATVELDSFVNDRKINEAKLKSMQYDTVVASELAQLKARMNPVNFNDNRVIDVTPKPKRNALK